MDYPLVFISEEPFGIKGIQDLAAPYTICDEKQSRPPPLPPESEWRPVCGEMSKFRAGRSPLIWIKQEVENWSLARTISETNVTHHAPCIETTLAYSAGWTVFPSVQESFPKCPRYATDQNRAPYVEMRGSPSGGFSRQNEYELLRQKRKQSKTKQKLRPQVRWQDTQQTRRCSSNQSLAPPVARQPRTPRELAIEVPSLCIVATRRSHLKD